MSIETHKRKKLFMGLDKGYGRNPEFVDIDTLWKRMIGEFKELEILMPEIIRMVENPQLTDNPSLIMKAKDEIADISNFCDFLFDSIIINFNWIGWTDIYGEWKWDETDMIQ